MKKYQFKTILFEYFNEKITEKFPILSGKIYRENLLLRKPTHPFLTIKTLKTERAQKRFETYYKDNIRYIKSKYKTQVIFTIHSLLADKNSSEKFADDVMDFVEELFLLSLDAQIDLAHRGIVVDEFFDSEIVEENCPINSDREFVKNITLKFEFEDIKEIVADYGKDLEIKINPKD